MPAIEAYSVKQTLLTRTFQGSERRWNGGANLWPFRPEICSSASRDNALHRAEKGRSEMGRHGVYLRRDAGVLSDGR